MRLEFDEQGYVCCILYGCESGSCVEYTGLVPTQPEEYVDIDDWANRAQTQAYYLDDQGNLAYDAERAAELPEEDALCPLTDDQLEALGIKNAIRSEIQNAIYDAIYPVGSIYISVNSASPETLFGGSWERIQDKFLLASGTAYEAGSEGGSENHSHVSPIGYNTANNAFGINYAGGASDMTLNGNVAATGDSVTVGSGTFTWKLPHTSPASNMPPYLAVFVWERIA